MLNDHYNISSFELNQEWLRKHITHGALVNIISVSPERALVLAAGLKEILSPGVEYVNVLSHRDFDGEVLNTRIDFTAQARQVRQELIVNGGIGIVCDFFMERPLATSKAVTPDEIATLVGIRHVVWHTWVQQLDFVLVEQADHTIVFYKCRGVPFGNSTFQNATETA
jgi:hypothetical protein